MTWGPINKIGPTVYLGPIKRTEAKTTKKVYLEACRKFRLLARLQYTDGERLVRNQVITELEVEGPSGPDF